MLDKYGKDGLVVLTLTIDESDDEKDRADYRDKTRKFLSEKKFPFATYDLDFDRAKPPAPLTFSAGTPRVFVFNRDNQYLARLPVVDENRNPIKEAEPDEIEKAIAEAVRKK